MDTSKTMARTRLLALIAAAVLAATLALGATPPPAFADEGGDALAAGSLQAQGDAADAPTLATMEFKSGTSDADTVYKLEPAFDPDVREYQLKLPDNVNRAYFFAANSEGAEGSIAAKYTNTRGQNVTRTIGASGNVSLTYVAESNSCQGNTLSIVIGDAEAYTVNIVRSATLKDIQLFVDENQITKSPQLFNQATHDYEASIPYGSTVTLVAGVISDGATIKINGGQIEGSVAAIEPAWQDDRTAVVEVEFVSDYQSGTYTITLNEAPALAITKPPIKTEYDAGDFIDATGMEVTATLHGEEPVALSDADYAIVHQGPVSAGMVEFAVSYEGQYAFQPITVNNDVVPEGRRIFSDIRFSTATASPPPSQLSLSPAFDPSTKYYRVDVYDQSTALNINLDLANPEADASRAITIEYTDPSTGQMIAKVVYPGNDNRLIQSLKNISLENNTFTLKVDGEVAYVFTAQRIVSPSAINVSLLNEKVTFPESTFNNSSIYFGLHDYDLFLNAGETVSILPSSYIAGAAIRLNGVPFAGGIVKPVWDGDYKADIEITFSKPGGITGVYTIHMHQRPVSLELVKGLDKSEYVVGEDFDPAGAELKATFSDGSFAILDADKVSWDLQVVPFGCESVKATFNGASTLVPLTVSAAMVGAGTAEEPFQVATADDYDMVRKLVASGFSFDGLFLEQSADITLPDGWTPIGVTHDGSPNLGNGNLRAFSGTLDGGGFTVTVPANCPPLIGYVKGATIKNLCVYGERIEGHGLVNNLEGVGLSGDAVILDGIVVKSGTNIVKSGLIGGNITTNGFAAVAADFVTTIRNCVVEEGVTVGCDGSESFVGGIAGRLQGTVENSSCDAVVRGVNYVGGIIASRDNAMGVCSVTHCTFGGAVEASGVQVGGIAGGCYSNETAPNGGRVSIQGCTVTGSVTGLDMVGGIQGADRYVDQPLANVASCMKGNSFTGAVAAMAEDPQAIGGIIGFMNGMNRCDEISGNYFKVGCGADRAWGQVRHVDTSAREYGVDDASGVFYYNTGAEFPYAGFESWDELRQAIHLFVDGERDPYTSVAYQNWNRDDDPLGADAELLFYSDEQLADYAVVDAALAKVPEGFADSLNTDESIKALQDAIDAVVQYKPAWEQDAVNAMAQAIEDAIAGLAVDENKAFQAAKDAVADAQAKAQAANEAAAKAAELKAAADAASTPVEKVAATAAAAAAAADAAAKAEEANQAAGAASAAAKYAAQNASSQAMRADTLDLLMDAKYAQAEAANAAKAATEANESAAAAAEKAVADKKAADDAAVANADLANAQIKIESPSVPYTGKAIQPAIAVADKSGVQLKSGTDYDVVYKDNVKVGTATVTVTGKGAYTGTKSETFSIAKASQTIAAKAKVAKKLKANKKTKKLAKNQGINLKKVAKVSAKTAVTFKKVGKVGGKRIAVNAKTGKVTVKKGLKKGTYKVKVKLTAAADANYNDAKAKTILLTVKVK